MVIRRSLGLLPGLMADRWGLAMEIKRPAARFRRYRIFGTASRHFADIVVIQKRSVMPTFFSTTTYAAVPFSEHNYGKRYKCDLQGGKMIRFWKYLVVFCMAAVVLPYSAQAVDTSFELNANADNVEGRVDFMFRPTEIPLSVGGGFIYSSNSQDYWLANINAAVKDEVFTPALSLGVGLKGVFGTTDFNPGSVDTAALPFIFLGEYDFRKMSLNWPISFAASIGYAPSVLSFSDTDQYLEFYLSGYFHINHFAALYLGYRNIDIDYEKSAVTSNLSDSSFYFGVRMSF